MDNRERYQDPEECLRVANEGINSGLWTAMPGIIESFNAANQTASVQIAIQAVQRSSDAQGTLSNVTITLLTDCPVQFAGGGGFTQTFPVKPGDECLVVFASRCIDAWWQSGGVQPQAEIRMHDLSDGFVLLGFRSVPRALPNISTDAVQLRTDDGETFIQINADGQVKISAKDIRLHASNSFGQDVNGYGTITTHISGNQYQVDNYVEDTVITTTNHPYNPPEIPS